MGGNRLIATNNAGMRLANRLLILRCIRCESLSRAALSQRVHLTRAAVTIIVEELLREGYLLEHETQGGGRGRRPVLLSLNPAALYFGGVNLRREGIDCGIVDFTGREIAKCALDYGDEPPKAQLARVCKTVSLNFPDGARIGGVGVCAPGPLDGTRGVILNPPGFDAWHGLNVAALMAEMLGAPVSLENISEAVALEEAYFGGMESCRRYMTLLVDSGIGSGFFMDGAPVAGSELGHTSIHMDGRPCACGNRGCLERYAAIPALLSGSAYANWRELMDSDRADAAELIERETAYLAQALVNAVNLLGVLRIVLRGDIAYKAERFLPALNKAIRARAVARPFQGDEPVSASQLPNSIRTAAMPAIYRFFAG